MASSHASTETDPTTGHEHTGLPILDEMRANAETWRIEWSDGNSRETTITAMAWYARESGPDATVTPVTDE